MGRERGCLRRGRQRDRVETSALHVRGQVTRVEDFEPGGHEGAHSLRHLLWHATCEGAVQGFTASHHGEEGLAIPAQGRGQFRRK